jgi:hypothetical protein
MAGIRGVATVVDGNLKDDRILLGKARLLELELLSVHLPSLPVYARQCGQIPFTQRRLTQPKLFRSDHGIRFISGPLRDSRAPAGICRSGTCPASLPRVITQGVTTPGFTALPHHPQQSVQCEIEAGEH